jgi:hypothetical protein
MTGFFSGLFYFLFGCVSAVYLILLFTHKKEAHKTKDGSKRIYINAFFQDPKECIRNIVRSKVSRNRPVIRALAKRAAVALLENGIVDKIASNLCEAVPDRLGIMGVKALATTAYTQSAYACLEVTLVDVDMFQFLKFNAGLPVAEKYVAFMESYGFPALTEFVRSLVLNFLVGKLLVQLPAIMKEKLYLKMSAEVEFIACTEEEQGPFLVSTIQQLKESGDEKKTAEDAQARESAI